MKFQLVHSRQAEKQLSKLTPQTALRLLNGCDRLTTNPYPDQKHVKKLKGYKDLYRLRVGDYRIVFRITTNTVEIADVITKQDFQKAY